VQIAVARIQLNDEECSLETTLNEGTNSKTCKVRASCPLYRHWQLLSCEGPRPVHDTQKIGYCTKRTRIIPHQTTDQRGPIARQTHNLRPFEKELDEA